MATIDMGNPCLPPSRRTLLPRWLVVGMLFLFATTRLGAETGAQGIVLPPAAVASERAADDAMEKAAEKAAEKVAEKAGKAVEKAAEEAVGKAVAKAAEQAVEMAAQRTATQTVEQAAERAVEKAAEVSTAKQELKAKRPDEWWGPTKVHFRIFVLDIDAIDDANQSFMGNVFVMLRWRDGRLANPQGTTRQMPLEAVWNPQVILANRQGLVSRSLPEVVQVDADGTVTYRQRYSGMLSQPLQLSDFPMDRHWFTIQFASAAYSAQELAFVPDASTYDPTMLGGGIADELSLQDWTLLAYETMALPYQPVKEIRVAGFAFRFEAERRVGYYLWQVLLPLSVVVVMSWAAFWIRRSETGVRIGVATSSVLTLIAHRMVLASLLPRLSYMTRMDFFTVGSTLLVTLALIGVVATAYLATIQRDEAARRVDLLARSTFPVAFVALLAWFLSG